MSVCHARVLWRHQEFLCTGRLFSSDPLQGPDLRSIALWKSVLSSSPLLCAIPSLFCFGPGLPGQRLPQLPGGTHVISHSFPLLFQEVYIMCRELILPATPKETISWCVHHLGEEQGSVLHSETSAVTGFCHGSK